MNTTDKVSSITEIPTIADAIAAAVEHLPWHAVHANLVTLTGWMYTEGYDAGNLADAVEKPWRYRREFRAAEQGLTVEDLAADGRECCAGVDVCGQCTAPADDAAVTVDGAGDENP